MAAAALTPRVRMMAICDEVTASDLESGVYTLEGVRHGVVADVLPYRRDLHVLLVLSYPRPGTHSGWVQVVDPDREKVIRVKDFDVAFDGAHPRASVDLDLSNCVFPVAGEYTFEVWFRAIGDASVQKGEQLFLVTAIEE